MNRLCFNHATKFLLVFALVGIGACLIHAKPDGKLAPAELVAKHLESIGSAENRAKVHGTRIKGACTISVRQGGIGQADGQALMASEGARNFISITFDSGDAPTWLRFDGNKTSVSQFRPGRRTKLEAFFAQYDPIVKEGLVGGTLSESWPLLNLQEKNPKLEYGGLKKIGGKQLHALKYTPRKGSDLKITLFFDAETFQHVRTEYEQTIYNNTQQRITGGGPGLPAASAQRGQNTQISAFEEFSDFKPEGGLNLPHMYKFELSIQSETQPALMDWTFNLKDFTFNTPLEFKESEGR